MAFRATKVLKTASRSIPVSQKYTLQSKGIWETIRRLFAVDPSRSNGVPLNPQFRNPPPGALDPNSYDDPVTVPAGDIADNPYWKRDFRRSYPRLSVVTQRDAVALLSVGSAKAPIEGALMDGEAGAKQLVELTSAKEGEGGKGLATFFNERGGGDMVAKVVLGPNGLPPTPSGLNVANKERGEKKYSMLGGEEQAYPSQYPCRTFV